MEEFESSHYILASLLKIALVIVCMCILFLIGLMLGFSTFGDGKATDVFRADTWTHIFEFLQP